jgi:hypothetical protein
MEGAGCYGLYRVVKEELLFKGYIISVLQDEEYYEDGDCTTL